MQRLVTAAIALVILFAGPASAADRYASIRTVGVLSMFGSKMMLADIGLVGKEGTRFVAVSDWDLDSKIVAWTSRAVAPRFTVKPIPTSSLLCSEVADCAKQAAADAGVDAIVVIHPFYHGPEDPKLFQMAAGIVPGGLGVLRQLGWLDSVYALVASYRVTVYDAQGKELDHGSPAHDLFVGAPIFVNTDKSFWSDGGTYPDAQLSQIKADLLRLMQATLPAALYDADLIPKPEALRDLKGMVLGNKPVPYFADPDLPPPSTESDTTGQPHP